ncbi:hypothetical protein WL58_09015 [Burkholderia cepacia]|nr:hypothetical protein WL58_09015 [Burkholderia cepacia]
MPWVKWSVGFGQQTVVPTVNFLLRLGLQLRFVLEAGPSIFEYGPTKRSDCVDPASVVLTRVCAVFQLAWSASFGPSRSEWRLTAAKSFDTVQEQVISLCVGIVLFRRVRTNRRIHEPQIMQIPVIEPTTFISGADDRR